MDMVWHNAILIHCYMVVMFPYLQNGFLNNSTYFRQGHVLRADDIRPYEV